ncbi:MAG: DUF3883 domain-containing protein [Gammaproteobacteria bacterium]|nr:DUF3883 domain-containing protein [Gammaproteobacteria bacterium]
MNMSIREENKFLTNYNKLDYFSIHPEEETSRTLTELGRMYYSGKDRIQDSKKAVFFYEKAIELTVDNTALYLLARIYSKDQKDKSGKIVIAKNSAIAAYLFSILSDSLLETDEIKAMVEKPSPSADKAFLDDKSIEEASKATIRAYEKHKKDYQSALQRYQSTQMEIDTFAMAAFCLANFLLSDAKLHLEAKDKEYIAKLDLDYRSCDYFDYSNYTNKAQYTKKALKVLKLAAKHNNERAYQLLAKIYDEGRYVEKDAAKSANYYKQLEKFKTDKSLEETDIPASAETTTKDASAPINSKTKAIAEIPHVKMPVISGAKRDRAPAKDPLLNEAVSNARPSKKSRTESEPASTSLNTANTGAGATVALSIPSRDSKEASMISPGVFNVTITQTEFIPLCKPELIDYSKVQLTNAVMIPASNKSKMKGLLKPESSEVKMPEKRTELSDKAKVAIGYWGEQCVYFKLKDHFAKKYCPAEITECDDGFNLIGTRTKTAKDLTIKKQEITVRVKWYNRTTESFKPLDLKVTKTLPGDRIKTRYIEVKSTTSDRAFSAHFSAQEVKTMLEHKKDYTVYRVFNAGIPLPRIEKLKDPLQKILDGTLSTSLDVKM